MISQADIIRTLINKNCTDESVMSTALSPDCTPPKLLEKLTETERFDLALDVSMKLGLDVIPLWRTWAIRCLRNRNFKGAREKFRHCFLRMRLPSGRTSPIQSRLMTEILKELTNMDEVRLPLSEEIELIKQRKTSILNECVPHKHSVLSKPKIYTECTYYLKEYGSIEDNVRFNIRNSLWDEAAKVLLDKSKQVNLDKFFIGEVVLYTTTTGTLSDLIASFLRSDPNVVHSAKYFKSLYNFCLRNRRYNLLYYIQTSIGDHIAAANTQISFFFLRRPVLSYRELNHRISSLTSALKNYQDYLEELETNQTEVIKQNSSFFTLMSQEEVEKQIKKINLQIDITRNFAINEVSGCINGIELKIVNNPKEQNNEADDSPVTLFEKSEIRKRFLAALVLIYFDLSCSTYFSKNGLDLANQLIDDYGLDKLKVFKTAMRIIMEDESCDILKNASLLLERLREDYLANTSKVGSGKQIKKVDRSELQSSSSLGEMSRPVYKLDVDYNNRQTVPEDLKAMCDEVIRDSIGSCREPDYKMELAKLLSGEAKIELYIEHGKLSNAQRLACNMNRPDYVSSIIEEAAKLKQNHVKTLCQLWLAKHETRNFIR